MLLVVSCSGSDGGFDDKIQIGALLPLSGALASFGETSEAALKDALSTIGDDKLNLVIEDTETDPTVALAKLKQLHDQGIKVVIGPYASSEVKAVKSYADQNGVILVSPLSTARTLAIADDNILRFTPDDEQEGVAMAALIWERGIRVIIPISRDDEGNLGLQSAVKVTFENLGGTVAPLITYSTTESDFQGEVLELSSAIDQYSAGQLTGIYLTAFSEVTDLFLTASNSDAPGLAETPWFGSDSVALSKDLIEHTLAAAFAVNAYYPNPILGLAEADRERWQPVSDRIEEQIERLPDAFALAAHDALTVAYRAMSSAGADADDDALRAEIISTASSFPGLTGSTALNAAGDCLLGNYDFWSIWGSEPEFSWTRVATYEASTETISQTAC